MTTEPCPMPTLSISAVDDQAGRIHLVYVGKRPFKRDDADDAVQPGEVIDENHPYATHTAQLRLRVDFTE